MRIYQRYGPAVLRKARRMLGSESDAQDVTQGLFVDLWQRGKTDVGLGYLYRAVTRRCLNHLRDHGNRARLLDQYGEALRPSGSAAVEAGTLSRQLLSALSHELPSPELEALVYRELDDMTQDEIAQVTGVSRRTIGKRLQRAEAALAVVRGRLGES